MNELDGYISNKIESLNGTKDPVLLLELAAYRMLITNKDFSLVVDPEFKKNNPEFLSVFRKARSTTNRGPEAELVVKHIREYGKGRFANYISYFQRQLPVICLQVDDFKCAGKFLNCDPEIIQNALDRVSYWKASEHLVMGCTRDHGHDYPSYLHLEKGKQSLYKFTRSGTIHETNHLLIDPITLIYKTYHTWLNEGYANIFRDLRIPILELKKIGWPELNRVLEDREEQYKYPGGQIALALMGGVMRVDRSWVAGAYTILSALVNSNGLVNITGINKNIKDLLGTSKMKRLTHLWNKIGLMKSDQIQSLLPITPLYPNRLNQLI